MNWWFGFRWPIRIIIKFKVFLLVHLLGEDMNPALGMDQQLWNYHMIGGRTIHFKVPSAFLGGFWLIAILFCPKKRYTPNLLQFNRNHDDSPIKQWIYIGAPNFQTNWFGAFSVDVLNRCMLRYVSFLWMILSYCDVDTYSVICWDA